MLSTSDEPNQSVLDAEVEFEPKDALEARVLDACDAIGEFIEYWGFKATHGRVWLLLSIHREPMSQKSIGEALSLSRGTISTVVSDLVDHRLIEATSDHRNAPYVAVTDFWPTIAAVLREREWGLISRAHVALTGLADELARTEDASVASRYDLDRVRSLIKLAEMAQRVLNLLIQFPMPSQNERVKGWFDTVSRIARKLRRSAAE